MLLIFCLLVYAAEVEAVGQGNAAETRSVIVDGTTRDYLMYQPELPDHADVPLMIVLHGGMGNAERIEQNTRMNDIADTGQFVVVYPNGTGARWRKFKDNRTWNAGYCCGRASATNVNDVRYIKRIIADVAADCPIDLNRVYVTGMSNGAMLAYRLACQIPEKIAAIVAVSGAYALGDERFAVRAKDIPVLHIHGDHDQSVPLSGGKGKQSVAGVAHRSVWETIDIMTKPRQCSGFTKTVERRGAIERYSYQCALGAPVELIIVVGGEHVWPHASEDPNAPDQNLFIDASKVAWEFVRQFSK